MEAFVARHPTFEQHKRVHGYELEFLAGFEDYYDSVETDRAKVDFLTFVNFEGLVGHTHGYLRFSRDLLLREFPCLLPSETLPVVLPPDLEADEANVSACEKLREAGYTLMADDEMLNDGHDALVESAGIVRVDFAARTLEQQEKIGQELNARGVQTLAASVDTPEQFDRALRWGYSYFQGDFFQKPALTPGKEIVANKLTYLRVLEEVNRLVMVYDRVESLIQQDVSMTYTLLRFMNSAWFGLRQEVHSIRHALVLLGPDEVRVWASLLVLRAMGQDKPSELMARSLTRAKMAEAIAGKTGLDPVAPELFLLGMFSLIDALTDVEMETILMDVPLNEDIKEALLGTPGDFRLVHDVIVAYEAGKWDELSSLAAILKLDVEAVPEMFRKSLTWANEALDTI